MALSGAHVVLDPHIQAFLGKLVRDGIPSPHTLPPLDARRVFAALQSGEAILPAADIQEVSVPLSSSGQVAIRIVRAPAVGGLLPVVLYLHGGCWTMGDFATYGRLMRELAHGVNAAVVFVEFSLCPEAHYFRQIEETYEVLEHIAAEAHSLSLDASKIAIVGDSSGGTLATAVTLLAKRRRGPEIALQVLINPILSTAPAGDAAVRPEGRRDWLSPNALRQRIPLAVPDVSTHDVSTFPLSASLVQLNDLPEALVVVAEHDIDRDDGEEYARRLSAAGVAVTCVRYNGAIHDFVILNSLAASAVSRRATSQIIDAVRAALCGDRN
jgi:acetyl esterase